MWALAQETDQRDSMTLRVDVASGFLRVILIIQDREPSLSVIS